MLQPAREIDSGSVFARWRRLPADVRLFAWLGMAADLDFLIGRHSYQTHSVGAVVVVLAAVLAWTRRPRLAVAGGVAYASHILLDWLGSDTTPPIGIMALFPFTTDFYQSELFVFDAISRRVWLWSTWVHNAQCRRARDRHPRPARGAVAGGVSRLAVSARALARLSGNSCDSGGRRAAWRKSGIGNNFI